MKRLIPIAFPALAALCAYGCRSHGPFTDTATLAANGRCEDAMKALVPAPLPPELMLQTKSGVVVGSLTCAGQADCAASADLTPVSLAMRGVARCYEERADATSLITAFVQLQQIVEGPVYDGSSDGEQQRVDAQLERVEAKLKGSKADYGKDILAKDGQISGAPAAPAH